jgi:sialidase-1
VLRRSTDGGTTWDPLEVIYTVSSSPGIDFYVVLSDARKGRTAGEVLWLFLQVGFDTLVLTSHDDGTTWDAPRSLSSWNATLPYPLKNPRPSVGHGIQLSGSGRLVVPMVCVNASASGSHGDRGCTTCNACLLYSDDHGETWEWGGIGQQGGRESAVAETASGGVETGGAKSSANPGAVVSGLYLNERNMGATPGHRLTARSTDGGETLSGFAVDDSLPTPVTADWTGIVAGLVRANANTLVYSAPENRSARKTLAMRTSSDDGATWSASKTLWAGPSGYSDIARIDDETVAVIYENGDVSFADRVSVSVVPVAWIAAREEGHNSQWELATEVAPELAPADAVRLVADYIINDTATYVPSARALMIYYEMFNILLL